MMKFKEIKTEKIDGYGGPPSQDKKTPNLRW